MAPIIVTVVVTVKAWMVEELDSTQEGLNLHTGRSDVSDQDQLLVPSEIEDHRPRMLSLTSHPVPWLPLLPADHCPTVPMHPCSCQTPLPGMLSLVVMHPGIC